MYTHSGCVHRNLRLLHHCVSAGNSADRGQNPADRHALSDRAARH